MKRILVITIILAFVTITRIAAQEVIPEPEFIGEAFLVDLKTNQYRKLPKERALKRNAKFSGYATSKLIMRNNISPLEISDMVDCAIIIRAENNLYDPIALFQIFKFEKNLEGARVCELASTSVGQFYSESNANDKLYIDFIGKKYGESSYILTFPISAGQYGVLTGTLNDQALIVSTFGVYDSAKRKADEEMRKAEEVAELAKKMKREERKRKRQLNQ